MSEIAVVTGGGSGLGEACALKLAERGALQKQFDRRVEQHMQEQLTFQMLKPWMRPPIG